MKPTKFAKYLSEYLTVYLPNERGYSANTIFSYRDNMLLFLIFMRDKYNIGAEKIDFKDITQERVIDYLDWLESVRNNSISTRNSRLSSLHAFFRFLLYRSPEQLHEWHRILGIKVKRNYTASVMYLSPDGIKLLLEQPDTYKAKGRRDLALLSLMYESAGRVQEIADLTPSRVHFGKPTTLKIKGKGNKTRIVPISEQGARLLKMYMEEKGLLNDWANEQPLFDNGQGDKLSRKTIAVIIKKYAEKARQSNPAIIPEGISPHSMRHSKAMMLQDAGVNLIYIRDFLGHSSVTTTEIYARISTKQKLEAIEKTSLSPEPESLPIWHRNKGLLEMLENLGK
ncbi:tyrosine-type recombinase/integrase [Dysgonomonas sp. GY617]|uniref:tyrosine-type recombinase/integrase n=1 Tax=Dysgonomonas sp. GY617 TaxID=2780420 RepID=UPI0018836970|nr:tyrosine-type recombinase/integrase [Dysgonomonas sp. GY617]MBF0577387.1 site-specific integrase [Dysgonomonas sp. GY617]